MKKRLLLALVLLCNVLVFAQKRVVELPAAKDEKGLLPSADGFAYMLPQTTFKVDVTIAKTNYIKGYYAEYAEKLLGLTNVILNNKTSYKLKNVKITPLETTDTNHVYWVELSNKQIKNAFLQNLYSKKQPAEKIAYDTEFAPTSPQLPNFFKNYSELTYIEKEDTYIEKKIIDSVLTEISVNQIKKVTKSVEQKAKEAADFIIKIRADRYALIAGEQEVPYTQEALDFLIKELNQSEKNYLELFTGITTEEDLHYTLTLTPQSNETQIPLFSFTAENGFNPKTDTKVSENNYFLQFSPQISQQKTQNFFKEKAKEEKYLAATGYKIRLAAPAVINLLQNKQIICQYGQFPILQYGQITTLPNNSDDFPIENFAIIY